MIDEGRERRGLAGPRAADEEHQTPLLHDGVEEHRREFEILEAGDLGLDVARHQGDFIALLEDVDPKTAYLGQGDGEVHLQLFLELLFLLEIHDVVGDAGHLARPQGLLGKGAQGAVELGTGGGAGGEIEIGTVLFGQDLQHVSQFHEGPRRSKGWGMMNGLSVQPQAPVSFSRNTKKTAPRMHRPAQR